MKCTRILVDADACPNTVKTILHRAVERLKIPMIFVANKPVVMPRSKLIKFVQVGAGFDVADKHIIEMIEPGDLVITADIPLADAVVQKGAHALNPRGELYTQNNIKEKLSIRNFMSEVRSTGQITGGAPPLTKQDTQKFANALDRFLALGR
ncbi:MAG TPA: YaiI/YqxD family protein [Gammaproteobacteria bacterium]|nr:YaiI/YqxD family protein [Gammaproteobacteria bacterium]